MKEQLLQFIWRYQYFSRPALHTEDGEPLQILAPGELNTHQGPDFLNAALRIGNTLWVGNIELHLRTSDWNRHAHETDKNYRNVILHVVWENDLPAEVDSDPHTDRRKIPLLTLHDRIPKVLLNQYSEWMRSRSFVACEGQLLQVSDGIWSDWKARLLEERLYRKALFIRHCLQENRQHWEETTWWLLARNFGLSVNAAAFEAVARSLPLRLLSRHRGRIEDLEALLLGQAGLLENECHSAYPRQLQGEFRFLRKKYRLPTLPPSILFFRMRPGNAPALRLAHLAGCLSLSTSWRTTIREAQSAGEMKEHLSVTASQYWDTHYALSGEESAGHQGTVGYPKRLGDQMKNSILINTCAPLLFAYGWLRDEPQLRNRALDWLQKGSPERNALVSGWESQGVYSNSAMDTQALLELKNSYCRPRKCLECAVGKFLLGQSGHGKFLLNQSGQR